MPTLPERPNTLDRDFLSWAEAESAVARLRGLVGDEAIVNNTDPVLGKRGRDERLYREMVISDHAVSDAADDRRDTLLSANWAFVPGTAVDPATGKHAPPSRLALELAAFAEVAWDRVPNNDVVLEKAWEAALYGWVPMRLRYIGRGHRALSFRGRSDWVGLDAIQEGKPWHYAYTDPSGYLVHTEGHVNGGWYVFDSPEDQMRHWTPRWGSASTPYGQSILQQVEIIHHVKKVFFRSYSTGMTRSTGTLKVSPTQATATGVAPSDAKWEEIVKEVRAIFDVSTDLNAIIQPYGWTIESMTDLAYNEGWQSAIRYFDDWTTRLIARVLTGNLGSTNNASGSRAAWSELEGIKARVAAKDGLRLFGGELTKLMRHLIRLNYGDVPDEEMPTACSSVGKISDIKQLALLAKASAGSGYTPDWQAVYAQHGVPVVEVEVAPQPAQLQEGELDADTEDEPDEVDEDGEIADGDGAGRASRAANPVAALQDDDFTTSLDRAMAEDAGVFQRSLGSLVDAYLEVAPDPLAASQPDGA